jgi:UDP-N-acetylglucosamine transferase subunit ALG13
LIFVTLGTHEQQFNRLLQIVGSLRIDHALVVQYGFSTYRLENCIGRRFFEFDEMRRLMAAADVVITHAGVGSIMLALAAGKRPIAAPRLHRFGEHVDDHQVEIAEAFTRAGKVTLFMPGDDLAERIAEADSLNAKHAMKPSSHLIDFLNRTISAPNRLNL